MSLVSDQCCSSDDWSSARCHLINCFLDDKNLQLIRLHSSVAISKGSRKGLFLCSDTSK